jgi:hypothetical protein
MHKTITVQVFLNFPKMKHKQSLERYIPSASSVVCQLHFSLDDIILYDKHLEPDGNCKQLL